MPFLAAVIPAVVEGAVATGVGAGVSALVSRIAAPPGGNQPPDVFDILNNDGNTSNFP